MPGVIFFGLCGVYCVFVRQAIPLVLLWLFLALFGVAIQGIEITG